MKRYLRFAVLLLVIFIVGLLAVLSLKGSGGVSRGRDDVLLLNEIAHKAAAGDVIDGNTAPGREFVILDINGNILFDNRNNRSETITVETAMQNRFPYTYIIESRQITGSVVLTDGDKQWERIRGKIVAGYCVCATLLLAAVFAFGAYIRRSIIIPFENLRDFASYVAAGDLDRPLTMDKGNLFGAFSESFDIMREELRASRERELSLQRKERELIASLSHDLKTPVTGIKLTSELMAAVFSQNEGGQIAVTSDMTAKMNNIYKRAEDINILVSDLFASTLAHLGEFKVSCADEDSSVIEEIVSKHDDRGLVRMSGIPEALIHTDKLRLSQVIGNIISNSYKYAGTPIDVSFRLEDGYLEMSISDSGPGVFPDEVELITNKFYRGKGQEGKEGSGLGLYIAKILMEKMGGDLCVQSSGGLRVTLVIPLS